MSNEHFSVRIGVRGYETDTQGHLNQAVYLQYAEHARWALLERAGIRQADMVAERVGPVVLETTIRYLRELRAGDQVDVGLRFVWRGGKTFLLEQPIVRTDGTVAAEITAVGGILDLEARKLVPDPGEALRALASEPGMLGL